MPGRWRLILRYLPPYRNALIVGLGALVLGNLCHVAAPVLFRRGIQAIEYPLKHGLGVRPAAVAYWAGAAICVALLGGLCSFAKRYLLMGTSREAETALRRDLFAHIQRLPMAYFDRTRTGDLMSRATADVEAARMAVGPAAMYLSDSVLGFGLALAVMLSTNVELTLYALGPLAGICAGLFFFAPRIHLASRAVQDRLAAISTRAQESFAGGRVVKTFAIEDHEEAALETLGRGYIQANVRLAHIRGATMAWISLMGAAGLAIVLFVGGRQVMAGTFDIAGLLLFNTLQLMLIWPMMAFGWVLSMVQRGAAGLDRLNEVFRQPEEASAAANGAAVARGALTLRGLDFAYDGTPVLHGVDVDLPAGRTLGIVGPTGSGKSTLVSLLPRLYDPPPGTLLIDGHDVNSIPLERLRGAIAFVPQEAFLFSATIRENVAFGGSGDLEAVVRDAHLHKDLELFPDGLDTRVGERGVTLSGGQKQRAALARALASDAPILVLDDALSAVDAETEATILENLRRHRAGRTSVVVAHRVSAVKDADLILFLRDGAVVERGTHDELVARGGDYARLARMQALEAEIEGMNG